MDTNHMPVMAETFRAFRRYRRMVPAILWRVERAAAKQQLPSEKPKK
jgi:hypothetical protein